MDVLFDLTIDEDSYLVSDVESFRLLGTTDDGAIDGRVIVKANLGTLNHYSSQLNELIISGRQDLAPYQGSLVINPLEAELGYLDFQQGILVGAKLKYYSHGQWREESYQPQLFQLKQEEGTITKRTDNYGRLRG